MIKEGKVLEDSDYEKLERQLADKSLSNAILPTTDSLAEKAEKQHRSTEFVKLGVHGIFSMLLSIFSPLMMSYKQKNIQKRYNDNERQS